MISIIIPMYNRWDLTHQRLMEIYKNIPLDDLEIVLVDDCSPEEAEIKGGVRFWQQEIMKFPVRYYRNKVNKGFGGTCNNGARLAYGDILVFLSNDVIVRGDFISEICKIISLSPGLLVGGEVVDWNGGWNEVIYNGHPSFIPYCNGWLLACHKDVWAKLGGFDPIYGRFDYEDVDLSTTAHYLGIPLKSLNSPYVAHIGGQTISSLNVDRLAQTNANRELWLQKWSDKLPELFERHHV